MVFRFTLALMLLGFNMSASSSPLFDSDEVLELELRGPVRSLLKDETTQPRAFQISVGGTTQGIVVSVGGKSRRVVCSFPPLRFHFIPAANAGKTTSASAGKTTSANAGKTTSANAGKTSSASPFAGQDMLRVVTHCKHNAKSPANLIEEYLAYRILNLITDYSYRVRLMRINYIDTDAAGESVTRYAFATESEYQLAQRMGGRVLETAGLPKTRLDEEHAASIYIFQYLIGNTDWSLVTAEEASMCCHNGQLIDVDSRVFYIPYDFDLAGLVNPRYAKPDPSLRIRRVTTRLYRGYCGPADALEQALAKVVGQRDAILALYRQAPALTTAEREKGIRFIEGFFRKAQNPEKLLSRFKKSCLG